MSDTRTTRYVAEDGFCLTERRWDQADMTYATDTSIFGCVLDGKEQVVLDLFGPTLSSQWYLTDQGDGTVQVALFQEDGDVLDFTLDHDVAVQFVLAVIDARITA